MAEAGDDDENLSRRQKRGLLKLFYGSGNASASAQQDIYDINEAHFQHDVYLERLFKEKTIHELMDKEAEIVKQIRSLDSDMQTLVYENYNKFISATDTIKKMKSDFRKMEDEMSKLDNTLSSVTDFSDKVNEALQDKRSQIAKLSGVHTLLHKLQFLFELPARLQKCIELKQYGIAVKYYLKARDVLTKYKHMPSFQGIHKDCESIVQDLMKILRQRLRDPSSSTRQLAECFDLLVKLGDPAGELCEEFLSLARDRVRESLEALEKKILDTATSNESCEGDHTAVRQGPEAILEFMDCGCTGFLSDIALIIASYNEVFMIRGRDTSSNPDIQATKQVANEKLNSFIFDHMAEFFKFIRRRLEMETQTEDNTVLVRALDKFYCKVQSVHQLFPESGIDRTSANIVAFSAHSRVSHYLDHMKQSLQSIFNDTKSTLVTSKVMTAESLSVSDIYHQAHGKIKELVKSVLLHLKAFIDVDVTFSSKPYFRGPFCVDDVREGLLVAFLKAMLDQCHVICTESRDDHSVPVALLLILTRLCKDFSNSTISQLINVVEKWFPVDEEMRDGCIITSVDQAALDFQTAAQELLNQYVSSQGLLISHMIRLSIESRDWLNTIEPRTVRSVMKRIIEDMTVMDMQVGQLFEEGIRKAASSDSSKINHSYGAGKALSGVGYRGKAAYGSGMDSSLLSNIQKLFSERIEVFTSVEFSKVSVLTGIVKISLKTLLECIRLRTFSKFGLQQMQVDTHYLQLHMWRFVEDENLVNFLLDEAVSSCIHRCLQAELMEPSVVEMICEKN